MKIDELDEWQGLTADMVRNYLAATGWHLKDWDYYKDWHLADCAGPPCIAIYDSSSDGMYNLNPEHALLAISKHERRTLQALLREINPRWRKGFPSNAALAEHDEWLIRAPWGAEFVAHISYGGSDDGYMIMIPPDSESGDCGGIEESVWGDCFYWPCDGNANRVRWPVDAEGKML